MKRVVLSLAVAATLACGALTAQAQPAARDLIGVGRVLEDTSNALGMIRGTGRTTNRGVIGVEYTATGTVQRGGQMYTVDQVVADFAHYMPAARVEWNLTDRKGAKSHVIEVVRDKLAWNEETPGGDATPMLAQAPARLRQVWLYPHAAIWAANDARAKAKDSVVETMVGGKVVLTVASPADGKPMKITLNADKRPERVEIDDGGRPLVTEFSNYTDFESYGIMFPFKIVQKRGNTVVMDLTVSGGHGSPYMAFPIPDQLKPAAGAAK